MDKAYIRELNFDCDTFSDAKESLNTDVGFHHPVLG